MKMNTTWTRLALVGACGAALLLVTPVVASARPARPARSGPAVRPGPAPAKQHQRKARVDKRENRQDKRIKQGVKSGEVTRGEAARLRKQQANIKRTERRAKADGKVTKKEARKIERKQDRADKSIRKAKHNDNKRPRAR